MKLLIVSSQVYKVPPDSYGGLERVCYDLAEALGQMGHEVFVLAPEGSKGEHFTVCSAGPAGLHNPEEQAYNALKASFKDFDLIHDHSWAGYPYMFKREWPQMKLLHTLHGQMAYHSKPVEKPCFVAASQAHADYLKREVGFDCKVCVPGWTRILLAEGGTTTIKDLVEEHHFAEVLGIGAHGPIRAQVLAHQKIQSTKELIRVHLESGASIEATPDHLILTKHGWVPAGNIGWQDEVIQCILTCDEALMATPNGCSGPVRVPDRGPGYISTEAWSEQGGTPATSAKAGYPTALLEEVDSCRGSPPQGELAQEDTGRVGASSEQTKTMGYDEGPQTRAAPLSVSARETSGDSRTHGLGIYGRAGGWRGAHDNHQLTSAILAYPWDRQQLTGDRDVGVHLFPHADLLRVTRPSSQVHGIHHSPDDVSNGNGGLVNYADHRGYPALPHRETRPCGSDIGVLSEPQGPLGEAIHGAGTGDRKGGQGYKLTLSKVKRIEAVASPTYVYDLTTSTGNFVANDIVVHNCHHGIDLSLYQPHTEKSDFLLYLNRVQDEKGALEFVALCKSAGMKGMCCGEDIYVPDPLGYPRRVMEACESSGGLVRYLGRIPHDYKLELLQKARCLVSPLKPPYIEIFGLSLLESMACGTPVLVTDQGAPRELVVHGLTGAVARDLTCLEANLKIALDCEPTACRARAEEFSRDKMAADYLELYRRIVEDKEEW